jgi:hypothetical protein
VQSAPGSPQLNDAGHEVIGTHNSPASGERLRKLGAKPVPLDLLDARAVRNAVVETEPEAVVQEATALANAKFGRASTTTTTRPTPARRPEADSSRRGFARQGRVGPEGAGDGS